MSVTKAANSDHPEICAFYHLKQNYSTSLRQQQQQQQQNIATKKNVIVFYNQTVKICEIVCHSIIDKLSMLRLLRTSEFGSY